MTAPRTILGLLATGTTMRQAPLKDERIEWWALAQLARKMPRCDRAFEIHDEYTLRQFGILPECELLTCPVVMERIYPSVKTCVPFPYGLAESVFKPACRAKLFLGNSVAYMLAFALLDPHDWKEIHLYGVDMQQGSEYEHQLRSIEHFLGIAIGRGYTVHFPTESELLKQRFVYGLEDRARAEATADIRERIAYFTAERERAAAGEDASRALRLKYDAVIANEELALKRAQL